jgi:hypothetical protein
MDPRESEAHAIGDREAIFLQGLSLEHGAPHRRGGRVHRLYSGRAGDVTSSPWPFSQRVSQMVDDDPCVARD